MAVHERDRRARVVVEILDRVDGELRVDHDHDGANFERAEQRRHELRAIRQRDDHSLLGVHAGALQQLAKAVGERLHLSVGERARVRQQRRPVSFALADPRIQQPISDV